MAIKEYTTSYSGANPGQDPDPVNSVQPDLANESSVGAGDGDELRFSQMEVMREKSDAIARIVGDSNAIPGTSISNIIGRDHATGHATQFRVRVVASNPANVAGVGHLIAKNVAGVAEAFWVDDTDAEVQITSGGSVSGGTAIAEEGASVMLFADEPASTQTLSSGTFADFPSSSMPEQVFSVTVAGVYDLQILLSSLSSVTTNQLSAAEYRLVVDEGDYNGFTAQTIGSNASATSEWGVWTSNGGATEREFKMVSSEVRLEAGTHKAKFQYRNLAGSPRVSTDDAFIVKGVLRASNNTAVDTPLPTLSYSTVTVVNVSASPGAPTVVRSTQQDGTRRSFTGTITFNPSSGATDGGLDTGTEANSTWYYLYLVPSTADSSVLAVRGSTAAPSTGPTGYTEYTYIGAVYNGSGGDIREFSQLGNEFWTWPSTAVYAVVGDAPFTLTSLSIASAVPATAGAYLAQVKIGASASGDVFIYWLSPTSATKVFKQTQNQITTTGLTIQEHSIVIQTPQTVYHQLERVGGSGNVGYIEHQIGGWRDAYLR